MIICSSINPSARNVIHLNRHCRDLGSGILNIVVGGKSTSCCFHLHPSHSMENYARLSVSKMSSCSPFMSFDKLQRSWLPKHQDTLQSFTVKGSFSAKGPLNRHFNISFPCKNMNMRLLVSTQSMLSKIKGNFGRISWSQDCVATGLTFGLLVCYSSSEQSHAEAAMDKMDKEGDCGSPHSKYSHGKKVYTDYSVIGIPGDGRCLFRSVVHGACVQAGKPAPNESRQRELADELRARVADEFLKRRKETEWFVEGDFNSYVAQIRKPHVWGGEPELFMASHVLKMPITVYMHDKDAGGLISIAEYGQEYGKENPIRVLYHGFGHYDALVIPGRKGGKSKL